MKNKRKMTRGQFLAPFVEAQAHGTWNWQKDCPQNVAQNACGCSES